MLGQVHGLCTGGGTVYINGNKRIRKVYKWRYAVDNGKWHANFNASCI